LRDQGGSPGLNWTAIPLAANKEMRNDMNTPPEFDPQAPVVGVLVVVQDRLAGPAEEIIEVTRWPWPYAEFTCYVKSGDSFPTYVPTDSILSIQPLSTRAMV